MIAQVVTATAPTPITDEARKTAKEMSSQVRVVDGCEGILSLVDPTTGEVLQINLFRDQTTLDAFEALRQTLTNEAEQDLGVKVSPEQHVYEVLVHL